MPKDKKVYAVEAQVIADTGKAWCPTDYTPGDKESAYRWVKENGVETFYYRFIPVDLVTTVSVNKVTETKLTKVESF